mmetsp:Transcript_10146/g.25746  ORF Transcript_10146/g.25746 Transcript_10146/m.25746 type:complete len:163 (-) Transcript_10146:223-711(-)
MKTHSLPAGASTRFTHTGREGKKVCAREKVSCTEQCTAEGHLKPINERLQKFFSSSGGVGRREGAAAGTRMVLSSDGLADREIDVQDVFRMTLMSEEARKGKWYANANPAVQQKLCAAYDKEPYPTDQQMKALAREVKAPSVSSIDTFYKSMQVKAMELCGN